VIPKYIDIDTKVIINNLLEKDKKTGKKTGKGKENKKLRKNIAANSGVVWGKLFRTNHSVFKKKGYKFNRMISTDGIGCSIAFIREDLYKSDEKSRSHSMSKPKNYKDTLYIKDLTEQQRRALCSLFVEHKMKLVGIDPGKNSPISSTDGDVQLVPKANGK